MKHKQNRIIHVLFFLYSAIIAYAIYASICIYGETQNECYLDWNKIHWNDITIHIHHWLSHGIVLFFITIYMEYSIWKTILLGANVGGIIHGIYTYDDWWKIVY